MTHPSSKLGLALLITIASAACNDSPVAVDSLAGTEASTVQAKIVGSPGDLAAMERIVQTFDQSWTAGDAVTYAAQYAGAEWVGPNGAVSTDSAEITGTYAFIFSVLLPGTTRQSTIRNITFLTGAIAVLDIDTRVTGFASPPVGVVPWQPGILRALEKNILVKRGNVWRIVMHQQTFVAPGI